MKKIRVLYYRLFKRAIIDNCLDSAYEDVNSLIENVFTNIGRHGFKLTYEELVPCPESFVMEFGNLFYAA